MRTHALVLLASSALLSGTAIAQQSPSPEAAPIPAAGAPALAEAPTPPATASASATPAAAPATATPSPPAATALPDSTAATPTPADSAAADKKFVLALRPFGVAFPMGNISSGNKVSDLTSALIPISLDVGYLVTQNIMVGIYAQYAIAGGGTNWMGSGSNYRVGVQAQYHPSSSGLMDPWVGLGIGYEILKMKAELFGYQASATLKGLEFANLQAGLDFRVWSTLGVGPFASFSLGQYSSASGNVPVQGSQSGSIDKKALHEWLTFGAHASLIL